MLRHPSSIPYRPDIDGLRALAILAVLIYHAHPSLLPGGFVGVDVFFVISGYLITQILLQATPVGAQHFLVFYQSRVRRIFPALALVLATCLVVGWIALLADEYAQLSRHTAAGAMFMSNFLLWTEVGYFDNAAASKPLLHLWSLAVEEQFYLIWPVLLWCVAKLKLRLHWVVLGCVAASFGAIYLLPPDAALAFYGPHFRLWELALGGLLASWKSASVLALNSGRTVWSVIGLLMIVAACFGVAADTHYPDWRALLPTVGTLLMIAAGTSALPNRWLAQRLWVGIGRISYPLYLWHWPLLSFAHIVASGEPSVGVRWACLAASFLLAVLTYRFLELPIRRARHNRLTVLLPLLALSVLGGLGWWISAQHGLPERIAPALQQLAQRDADWQYPPPEMRAIKIEAASAFAVGGSGPQTLFYGDSNVEQYAPRIAQLLAQNSDAQRGAIFLTQGARVPIHGVARSDLPMHVDTVDLDAVMRFATVDRVVIGASWVLYFTENLQDLGALPGTPLFSLDGFPLFSDQGRQLAAQQLTRQVLALRHQGKEVYLVAGIPAGHEFGRAAGLADRRHFILSNTPVDTTVTVARALVEQRQAVVLRMLQEIAAETGAHLIDPVPHLCAATQCSPIRHKDVGHLRASYVRHQLVFLDQTVAP